MHEDIPCDHKKVLQLLTLLLVLGFFSEWTSISMSSQNQDNTLCLTSRAEMSFTVDNI